MKRELDYFSIGDSYGGNQDWFQDRMMHLGGCAAATACDICIYFDLNGRTRELYPFEKEHVTREDYIRFSQMMKPYLSPRWQGIDRLDIYTRGLGQYLSDRGEKDLKMSELPGDSSLEEAELKLREQIDKEIPVPCLMLKHKNPNFKDYVWHWFLLTGYETYEDIFMVKIVTYGSWRWMDFKELWSTGYRKKGGLVLFY